MWFCCTDAVLLYALLLWNLITPAMRMRSFRSGAKQGLLSVGGVLQTFSFFMSLMMHVAIVVALGNYSVYLTTTPLLLASSVLFLAKSCVDKEFRTWRLGPKLTHCLISSIFPVTTPRPASKKNKQEDSDSIVTANVRMAGNEFFFVYFLHFSILILGMAAFALLSVDPEYAEKMRKLKEESTISMAVMVYIACPVAFLLSILSQLVFRKYLDPWKPVRSSLKQGCCPGSCWDCKPVAKSRVIQRTVQLQDGTNSKISIEETGEVLAEEIGEIPVQGVQGEKAVAVELEEIFHHIRKNRNNI